MKKEIIINSEYDMEQPTLSEYGEIKEENMELTTEIKKINLPPLEPGIEWLMLDLHNGSLSSRLISLGNAMKLCEKSKSQKIKKKLTIVESSAITFLSEITEWFGYKISPENKSTPPTK